MHSPFAGAHRWRPTPPRWRPKGAPSLFPSACLGGKVQVEVELPGDRAVVTVLGRRTFSSLAAPPVGAPAEVVSLAPPAGLDALRMMLDRVVAADAGDVDISAADLLVSVGRGIESADNLVTVQELADVLGAALSGSRPVVDAGWLPKGRQVGQSGLKVKPRAYLALGISGAPRAPGGHAQFRTDHRLQHRSGCAHLRCGPLRHHHRPV